MNDNYTHNSNQVLYTSENIPGPIENSTEYDDLINLFNSQILPCSCNELCLEGTCDCLMKSGNANYHVNTYNGKLIINYNDFKMYPIIECNSECSCTDNCVNRLVQKGPIEGLYVSACGTNKGLGLFTKGLIPRGTFICEYAGELITKTQASQRSKTNVLEGKMNFIFCLNEYSNGEHVQYFVDPSYIGNIGRYINHSCEPNSHILPVRCDSPVPKLAIFAQIDILPGTEITYCYGSNSSNQSHKVNSIQCLCNSKQCNGYLPYDEY